MLNCLNPIVNITSENLLKQINNIRRKDKKKLIKSFSYFNNWTEKEKELLSKNNNAYKNVDFYKCRKCETCKIFKRYDWLKRIDIEREKWKYLFFITLTFDNEHINKNEFVSRELSSWFKKQKKAENLPKDLAYIAAAEFGEKTFRKHYHILLMSNEFIFYDLEPFKNSARNNIIYTSSFLNAIWEKGSINSVQIVESNACFKYMLKYTTKLKNKGEKLILSRGFGKPWNFQLKNLTPENLPTSLSKAAKQKIRYWEQKLKKGECTKQKFNSIFLDYYSNLIINLQKEKNKINKNKFWSELIYKQGEIKANYNHNFIYFNHKTTEF